MVDLHRGFEFPEIDRVQDPFAKLSKDETAFVRSTPAETGAKFLQRAGIDLSRKLDGWYLDDVQLALAHLDSERSSDGRDVYVSNEVSRGLYAALDHKKATATIATLENEFGENAFASTNNKEDK